jgi:single-strand DNA-binding protein
MPSVNKVIIVGNLTRDPVTKQLPTQSYVTEFGLAMNRKFKDVGGDEREEVCFIDCAAFGRQAEVIQKYCRKGKSLYVEGRLKYDSWDDKNGHGKRSKVSIVVENFQFLGGKEDGPPPSDADDRDAPARKPRPRDDRGVPRGSWDGANLPPRQATKPTQPFGDKEEFRPEDVPF